MVGKLVRVSLNPYSRLCVVIYSRVSLSIIRGLGATAVYSKALKCMAVTIYLCNLVLVLFSSSMIETLYYMQLTLF
jgi:hypothetical protein